MSAYPKHAMQIQLFVETPLEHTVAIVCLDSSICPDCNAKVKTEKKIFNENK